MQGVANAGARTARAASGCARTAATAMRPTCPAPLAPPSGFRAMPEVTRTPREADRADPPRRSGNAGSLGELDRRGLPHVLAPSGRARRPASEDLPGV